MATWGDGRARVPGTRVVNGSTVQRAIPVTIVSCRYSAFGRGVDDESAFKLLAALSSHGESTSPILPPPGSNPQRAHIMHMAMIQVVSRKIPARSGWRPQPPQPHLRHPTAANGGPGGRGGGGGCAAPIVTPAAHPARHGLTSPEKLGESRHPRHHPPPPPLCARPGHPNAMHTWHRLARPRLQHSHTAPGQPHSSTRDNHPTPITARQHRRHPRRLH